ncbi:MAG: glycoside hydrolase family 9 protein [Fibrobacterota bacterium]
MNRILTFLTLFAFSAVAQLEYAGTVHFKVDQFGYHSHDSKVMVISQAREGFNAETEGSFEPGSKLEVRSWSAGEMGTSVVFTGEPLVWNEGETDPLSGDAGWWFDFSEVTEPGEYVVYDPQNDVRSHPFRIGDDVYRDVLKAAVKSFYFQREGFEKTAPFAGEWTDEASHLQDTAALDLETKSIRRDVTGGWMDAGDQNKYITFVVDVIHSLLIAYEENPSVFTDDFEIPESGNGVPDILDEIVWELEWMIRMQDTDGGVFIKTGSLDHNDPSPPSADTRQRYYGPKCTSSGLAAASTFAHASIVLRDFPLYAELSDDLALRAEMAWDWVEQKRLESGFQTACDAQDERIQSGNADRSELEQEEQAVTAAVYLFALTGKTKYNEYVIENYEKSELLTGTWWGPYKISFQDAVLRYTTLEGADSDVSDAVLSCKSDNYAISDYYDAPTEKALYRAYMPEDAFHWGHNAARGNAGNILMQSVKYNVNPEDKDQYMNRARQMVHWFHGVNALGKVYLTNMYDFGAENSAYEIFHSWFAQDTEWQNALTGIGPAPGIVPGGPNKDYGYKEDDPSRSWFGPHTVNLKPPYGQPPEKSYKDWGKAWNTEGCIDDQCQEGSYAVTENAIYYQSAYVRLLSHFVDPQSSSPVRFPDSRVRRSVIGAPDFRISAGNLVISGIGGCKGEVVLRNLKGRVVVSRSLDGGSKLKIPTGNLAAGVFFVELRSGMGSFVSKLIHK